MPSEKQEENTTKAEESPTSVKDAEQKLENNKNGIAIKRKLLINCNIFKEDEYGGGVNLSIAQLWIKNIERRATNLEEYIEILSTLLKEEMPSNWKKIHSLDEKEQVMSRFILYVHQVICYKKYTSMDFSKTKEELIKYIEDTLLWLKARPTTTCHP
jgi:hypothetical protein